MEETAEDKTQIIFNDDATFAYLPFHGLMLNAIDKPASNPSAPVEKLYGHQEYVSWGDDNDYPGYVEEKAHKNNLIPAVLNFKANQMAAAGLYYGIITGFDKRNKPVVERIELPDIEEFWDMNNKQLFLEDLYRNLFWFHHGFGDVYMNGPKSRIVAVSMQDTAHCRYSVQNEKTGNKDWLYIDANWPRGTEDTWQKVRCIDPYHDWIGQMKSLPSKRFIYPLFFNSPKKTFYQRTPWHSLFESKWLDLAEKIPIFKSKLMDNQMVIKYVLHVPEDYWRSEFKLWDSMKDGDKMAARKAKLKEMNEMLTGVEKSGKAIMLSFKTNQFQKEYGKWEVQEMKGNLGEGAYIEDSHEASTQILFSLAFHGALIGQTPGKAQAGGGSGSEQRLADEGLFKNNKPYAMKACEFFNVITRYNGWKGPNDRRVIWFPEETILTTLDNISPQDRPKGS